MKNYRVLAKKLKISRGPKENKFPITEIGKKCNNVHVFNKLLKHGVVLNDMNLKTICDIK